MTTRQEELLRVLGSLAEELPDPDWVALVDDDGLIVACIPDTPVISQDQISGMTAASVISAERVLAEIDGGRMRYTNIAGSHRQLLTVVLSPERLLAIGLGPEVPAQATFASLTRWVPEILAVLKRSFVAT
jgi:predicted regulator of Ras-like GTPase activity (Roadblock/LC7/MglB family)